MKYLYLAALTIAVCLGILVWQQAEQDKIIALHLTSGATPYQAWCAVHHPETYISCVESIVEEPSAKKKPSIAL